MPRGLQTNDRSSVLCPGPRPGISHVLVIGVITLVAVLLTIPQPSAAFDFPYPTNLWVWGANSQGELGDGADVNLNQPILQALLPVGTLSSRLAAAHRDPIPVNGSHSLAVDRNQNLWAWGYDVWGEVGDGKGCVGNVCVVFSPVRVCDEGQTAPCTQFLRGVTATAAGGYHSLALDVFGNVWAWGNNDFAQVGSGCTLQSGICSPRAYVAPVRNNALFAQLHQTCSLPIATAIAAGTSHSLALDACGVVWAWGLNSSGQLGINSNDGFELFATPSAFRLGTTIIAIAAGGDHSLALDKQGHLWAWGDNSHGQLGIGNQDIKTSNVPMLLPFPQDTRFTTIAAGGQHSLAIEIGGSVWAWGANDQGQLGIGTNIDSFSPAMVSFPSGIARLVAIAAGGVHSLAIDGSNNVWAWGSNDHGQLGNPAASVVTSTPVRSVFPDGTSIVSIAAGTSHSLALEAQSFLFGLEAAVDLQLQTFQALLVPHGLAPDPINLTTTSSPIGRAGRRLLVTNTLTDPTGHKLVLTVIQEQQDSKRLALEVQSIQYNGGAVITPPPNRIEFHWHTDKSGAITKLTQHLVLGKSGGRTEIVTHYHKAKNQTTIHVDLPTGRQKFAEPGMVVVQTSTLNGALAFSDGTHLWP
ncbi:MAG TPA: hypothetical protein VMS64_23220 [Candidatus Methylomirabilis sp.]|nr:hypothetical protein [Candidatus Methylomirabilis sp.]